MTDLDLETSADPFQLCGTTIDGKFRISSVVGDGGFGVVYRGVHKGFGELIAVKCLKIPAALDEKQQEELLEQLREEGRLLHRLSKATPGIVQALDVGAFVTPAGVWVPYLVLEWLEGETLSAHLAARKRRGEPPYTLDEAIRLLEPAARALAVAHQHKVAHRDVKPPNLFVAQVGSNLTLKVLDFGIAKVLSESSSYTEALAATRAVPTAFTPRYGAPEQFNKQRGASGPWTDVFALALILVEVLTGQKALEGDDPTQLYIASADPTSRPTPRRRGIVLPEAVEAVLEKALSVEPKYRYPEAGAFWDALVVAAGAQPVASNGVRSGPSSSTATTAALGRQGSERSDVSFDATVPAEHAGTTGAPPMVVSKPGGSAAARGSSAKLNTADPMAETPPVATPPPTRVASTDKAKPSESEQASEAKSGSAWPWVALLLLVVGGAGAGAWTLLNPGGGPKKAKPVASAQPRASAAKSSVPVTASAATAASSAVVDGGSAEPELLPVPSDMIYVTAGSFKMSEGEMEDAPEVTISRPFYIDRTEVTVRAYLSCVEARMCSAADKVAMPEGTPIEGDAEKADDAYVTTWSRRCNAPQQAFDHPINCVDYASAESFCRWKGRRLPTEAEWEFAARGSEGRIYPWGNDAPECGRACYDKNGACFPRGKSVTTCPAGLHPADKTPTDIFDMAGNVSEWVADGFVNKPPGGTDPVGDAIAPLKVVRGGSFLREAEKTKGAWRVGYPPAAAPVSVGFRCALDADKVVGVAPSR